MNKIDYKLINRPSKQELLEMVGKKFGNNKKSAELKRKVWKNYPHCIDEVMQTLAG